MASGSIDRACTNCACEAATVTGSPVAMAVATAANAACAGFAPQRQLLVRSGHSNQVPECGSNSPGMRKPSAAGVVVRVLIVLAILPGTPAETACDTPLAALPPAA